jgi:hypothetical protein
MTPEQLDAESAAAQAQADALRDIQADELADEDDGDARTLDPAYATRTPEQQAREDTDQLEE